MNQGSAWPPTSFAHSGHMASNALPNVTQNDCYACHGNTINSSGVLAGAGHLNNTAGDLAFATAFNYQGTAVTPGGTAGTARTCSNVLCHNGVATPTWGSGAIACGKCHNTGLTGPLPSGTTGADHSMHANNDTNYADCANCHLNAGSYAAGHADHQNLAVNVSFTVATLPGASYSDAVGGVVTNSGAGVNYGGDFTDNGTCASVECHFNVTTPGWSAAASAYPARCVVCHNDGSGTALKDSVPTATAVVHDKHVTNADADYVASDCAVCHGAGADTATHSGHGQLNGVDFAAGLTYSALNKNCTNDCHLAPDVNDWTDAATLTCNDCHTPPPRPSTSVKPSTAAVSPATGEHAQHDASPLVGTCTTCHPHSGALGTPATTKHVNGTLATSIDVDGTVITDVDLVAALNQTQTVTGWAGNCTNTCHTSTTAAMWTNGSLTLTCNDCHNKAAKTISTPIHAGLSSTAGPATGKHSQHVGGDTDYMGANSGTTCHKHQGQLGATGHSCRSRHRRDQLRRHQDRLRNSRPDLYQRLPCGGQRP